MYLDNLNNPENRRLKPNNFNFLCGYNYWKNILFEKAMKIFVWKNTYEVPAREIESILLLNGSCGVTDKYKNKLAVFNGQYAGSPTVYYDVYEDYSVYSPLYSDVLKIDKDIIIGRNDSLMNSIYPLIHRYAIMLSHTEVSFVNTLINGRDSGGIPIASTDTQIQAIEKYRNDLCNGKVGSIEDPALMGVNFIGVNKNGVLQIKDLIEVRQNLIDAFLNDIGVKTSYSKKGNMIVEEVEANDGMLLLNLKDMLSERQMFADKVNNMFGTNWQVDIADEIKYNQREESEVDNNEISNN